MTVISPTDHRSICLLTKGSSLIQTRIPLPTPTKYCLKNRPTEKPSEVFVHIWGGTRSQPAGKVSVRLPTDDWLCNKMAKLNITLVEGYPSRSSEAGGLLRDQFVRPPKSQTKWYGLFSDQKSSTASRDSVTSWNTDASKLNSLYSRIARAAGIALTPPPSRQITHDNLRRWEKSAREASTYCNQAAGFNRCLLKVQENTHSQLKILKSELSKGKGSSKVSSAVEELQFLTDFNSNISQAMAKTMEHLSDFVFVAVANSTLARRDAYLSHLKAGIKPDTLASLRTAPLQMNTLFPDEILKQAEQDIANFEAKNQPPSSSKKGRFHPYDRSDKCADNKKQDRPAWKNLGYRGQSKRGRGKTSHYSSRPAKGPGSLKTRKQSPKCTNKTMNSLCVNSSVVEHVLFVKGQSQKKDISPVIVPICKEKLKSVKNASFVTHLPCAQTAKNVKNVVQTQTVGARLQNFWQTWLDLGPKVVQTLREGYILPFRIRPKLARYPTVISRYVDPRRNSYLLEALHQLMDKNAVELVQNQASLGFYNRLFLVPKPNNKWRPILDLSKLNLFLKVEKFKMETPETIRTSLQTGEWVTSIDFKDAYFHIPIQEQSRKCLRFHVQGQTYHAFSTFGIHNSSKGSETDGPIQGYKDPPVPRRLVGESHIPPGLSPAYQVIGSDLS